MVNLELIALFGGVDSHVAVCIEIVRNCIAINISSSVFSENVVASALETLVLKWVQFVLLLLKWQFKEDADKVLETVTTTGEWSDESFKLSNFRN